MVITNPVLKTFFNLCKHVSIVLALMLAVCYGQTIMGVIMFGVPVTAFQSGGDMSGAASSVVDQVFLAANTTGKLAKMFTGSGFYYFTNGVPVKVTGTVGHCFKVAASDTVNTGDCGTGGGGTVAAGPGITFNPTGSVVSVNSDAVQGYSDFTGSVDFGTIPVNSCLYDTSLTFPGALVGDFVVVSRPATIEPTVVSLSATILSGNVVQLGACAGATSVNPNNNTFKFKLLRRIE